MIDSLISKLIEFRNERDWEQFHNPKDLAIALSIEANELLELFLWKDQGEVKEVNKEKVKEELADVLHMHSNPSWENQQGKWFGWIIRMAG